MRYETNLALELLDFLLDEMQWDLGKAAEGDDQAAEVDEEHKREHSPHVSAEYVTCGSEDCQMIVRAKLKLERSGLF